MLLPPIRKILLKLFYKLGSGAGESIIKNNWCEYQAVAETDTSVQPKSRALDQMCYNGDLYIFTTIALGEAAQIVLWQQDTWAHKFGSGVLMPATLGDHRVSQL